ncbi:acetyl-CoA C-acetyltransferase [Ruoffia tabacinasalis]|uniref:acetyl-CoA C-acetyltransferase n=1 Tax=Ruoffia tabacinasalis TaxID=87458 RepID=A0ABS0LLI4_9LACT|nr:acetyl-CoA C-acetyltransferase [Ruoffia tabacinasalis]MBG9979146.1 acetyl-CoA C-acetyltransferase [Ruoffia tabacinasalis]
MQERKVYILSIKRTAVGSFLGSLSDLSPAELGSKLLEKMLEEDTIVKDKVDEVIIGNILSAGHGQNIARQVSVNAGISINVPAYGVNMLCGSGLKAINEAYNHVKLGDADCIIAGGVESMSQAKFATRGNIRKGNKMGAFSLEDTMLTDGLTDAFSGIHMGITAENIASKFEITREEQDEFSMNTQEKARLAQKEGKFKDEIVPITVQQRRQAVVFEEDEYINHSTNLEKLNNLRPAFDKEGSVTAGNASGINDGAAFAFVVSDAFVKEHNLEPLVEVLGFGQSGVDPKNMGIGPVKAINSVMKKTGLSLEQFEVIELNEAFASQSIGVMKELTKDTSLTYEALAAKVNPNGGAIAIGHPIGASGARISATLIHEMKRTESEYGLASLCIGGGMGISMAVKNV